MVGQGLCGCVLGAFVRFPTDRDREKSWSLGQEYSLFGLDRDIELEAEGEVLRRDSCWLAE